jgi:hypothetical protein
MSTLVLLTDRPQQGQELATNGRCENEIAGWKALTAHPVITQQQDIHDALSPPHPGQYSAQFGAINQPRTTPLRSKVKFAAWYRPDQETSLRIVMKNLDGSIIQQWGGPVCYFSEFSVDSPPTTLAGQPFEIVTSVRVACPGGAYAYIRVDLIDPHSTDQKVLSTNSVPIPLNGATQIANDVTAPNDLGTWVLQANAYIISQVTGRALASNQKLFSVQITPYTSPSTTTVSSVTMTPITINTPPATSTSQQVIVIPTQTLTTHNETAIQDYSPYYIAELLGLTAVVVGLVAMMKHRKRKAKEKSEATSIRCVKCGTELPSGAKFCGNCGNKQPSA